MVARGPRRRTNFILLGEAGGEGEGKRGRGLEGKGGRRWAFFLGIFLE